MASSDEQGRRHCCFQEWIHLQEQDLSELLQGLAPNPDSPNNNNNNNNNHEASLSQLTQKIIQHFQDYIDKRSHLARDHVSALFAPTWCTSLENSHLWIAGCRPSTFIRLIYALCGPEIESQLAEFLQGVRTGNLGELSAHQLTLVNTLQGKTIREEERLSSKMASLEEEVADQPLAVIANEASEIGELNREAGKALDDHAEGMASMMEEADRLRMRTLRELIDILTPKQAVDFLVASKKLHLSMHEWGRKIDHMHGS